MKSRPYALVVLNALLMAALTVLASISLGYPLRDPDGFLGPAWVRMPMLIALAFGVDIVPRVVWPRLRSRFGKARAAAKDRGRRSVRSAVEFLRVFFQPIPVRRSLTRESAELLDAQGVHGRFARLTTGTPIYLRLLWNSPLMEETKQIVRSHWTRSRVQLVVVGVICFYVVYVCYRNLKNFLPFLRPIGHNDYHLHQFDSWLLFGHDPALLLHKLLGTGISAHVLSWVYLFFLPMVPVAVVLWLVWSGRVSFGWWFVTADCLAWTLGTLSYYVIPTLGPNFFYPWLYSALPNTGVSALQDSLFYGREHIRFDPFADGVQSVAGFASLHVGITLMMALVAQYTFRRRAIRVTIWVYTGLVTVSTSYFGWHYLADDLAGAVIAWVSFYVGALATGHRFETTRLLAQWLKRAPEPEKVTQRG